jgi:hypothetical protein
MIYAAAQFIEEAQSFYADVKRRMARSRPRPGHAQGHAGPVLRDRQQPAGSAGQVRRARSRGRFLRRAQPDGPGRQRLSARRAPARSARAREWQGPLAPADRARPPRESDDPPALPALQRGARPPRGDRHADRHRRPDPGLVRARRRRRLQPDPAAAAELARRVRRSGGARAAAPRPVPHRICRHDAARASRICRAPQIESRDRCVRAAPSSTAA